MAPRRDDLAKVWTASTTGEGAAARARDVTARRPHRAVPADGADRRPVGGKGSPWAVVLGAGGETAADQASRRAVSDRRIVALTPSREGWVRLRVNGRRLRRSARSRCDDRAPPRNPDQRREAQPCGASQATSRCPKTGNPRPPATCALIDGAPARASILSYAGRLDPRWHRRRRSARRWSHSWTPGARRRERHSKG